jgi:hypothetical protein
MYQITKSKHDLISKSEVKSAGQSKGSISEIFQILKLCHLDIYAWNMRVQ